MSASIGGRSFTPGSVKALAAVIESQISGSQNGVSTSGNVRPNTNFSQSHVHQYLGQTSNNDFSPSHVQQYLGQPHESPSIGAAGPIGGSSEVRAVLANRCLESTAVVARATARLMQQKDPIFEKPPHFNPSSDASPRQALATDIMDLLNYTKTLATRSALHPLTVQQSKHLECAENFGKCLERYCQPGKSGSDLSLLLLTRSILGHLDQVIATTMLDPIEVTKANLKDSTNWEVFAAIKDRASGDIGLRTIIPNEKTAIHAILYGGNSVGSQSTQQLYRPILTAPVQQRFQVAPPNPSDAASSAPINADPGNVVSLVAPNVWSVQVNSQPFLLNLFTSLNLNPLSWLHVHRNPEGVIAVSVGNSDNPSDSTPVSATQVQQLLGLPGFIDAFPALTANADVTAPIHTGFNHHFGDSYSSGNLPHPYYPMAQQTTNPALLTEAADAAVVVDSTQPQTASFKEIKTAFDTVVSVLKQYIGSNGTRTAENTLCNHLSEASEFIGGDELCQDVPKWIKSMIKDPMRIYTEQKLPEYTNPTQADVQKISEVSKLPSRFEKAVQAALDNPQISYDKLKILLYGDRPLEIDRGAPLTNWESWKRKFGMG